MPLRQNFLGVLSWIALAGVSLLSLLVALAAGGAENTAAAESGTARAPLAPPPLAAAGVLDRLAYAVDGAESSHGADPRMWRSEADGPQGPMQVSAAAAADAGGGDRFDENQNRVLGRLYLAQMYRRYGTWPDAVAAYNWGPGRMDGWISGGRPIDKFPAVVDRYRTRVLVTSGLPGTALDGNVYGSTTPRLARLGLLRLQARRQMEDRHRRGNRPEAVELLYADIMRASDPAVR
jgi:Transglycosylase SLT domain